MPFAFSHQRAIEMRERHLWRGPNIHLFYIKSVVSTSFPKRCFDFQQCSSAQMILKLTKLLWIQIR